ncbi:MAG: UDP-N-acetylmuramate dehydrogenase, partial [Cellulosilyticaceae bacterium]
GFVINKGDATFEDVMQLIEHVQKVVKERFNVELEAEVRIIGER